MKTIVFGCFMIATMLNGIAQDPVNETFNQYAGKEGFTTVNITGELFKMLVQMNEEQQQKNITTQINEIKILAQEEDNKAKLNFHKLIYNKLDKKAYKEILTVQESDKDIVMLAKETEGIITEFLVIASGTDNVLIRIKGNIVLNELDDLTKSIDLQGLEMLSKLETGENNQ